MRVLSIILLITSGACASQIGPMSAFINLMGFVTSSGYAAPLSETVDNYDELTILGGVNSGFLSFYGTTASNYGPQNQTFVASINTAFDVDGGFCFGPPQFPNGAPNSVQCMIPFVTDQSIPMSLFASAQIGPSASFPPPPGTAYGAGLSIQLTSIAVSDSNGNPVTGAIYTNLDGALPLVGGVFVPEPVPFLLTILGILAMLIPVVLQRLRFSIRNYPTFR